MSSVFRNGALLVARTARQLQSRNYSDAMKLTLAAGNRVFYDRAEVKQVDVPSYSGDFGILAAHVPTLAVLKPGIVQVYEADGKVQRVFVSSGTVTVNVDSSVQVLAEEAHPVEDLDARSAQEAFQTAQSQLSSAKTDQERAEAQLAVEVAELVVNALK